MYYLKVPLQYLPRRSDAQQGAHWWDRAVEGLLASLKRTNHIDPWATSSVQLSLLTPETALVWEDEKGDEQ